MKNKNIPQAILFKQGKKALEGDVSGHTDAEVRGKGMRRIARRAGVTALITTVAVAAGAYGIAKENQVDAAQVRADKEAAGKLLNPADAPAVPQSPNTGGVAPTISAPEATGTAPAASTEGAWTPTPEATPVSVEPGTTGQSPDTGGLPAAAPEVTDGPQTGGVTPN